MIGEIFGMRDTIMIIEISIRYMRKAEAALKNKIATNSKSNQNEKDFSKNVLHGSVERCVSGSEVVPGAVRV